MRLNQGLFAGLLSWIAIVCSPVAEAVPVAWDEPGQSWKTLTSEHFAVHYPDGFADMAQRAIDIGERVHRELVPFFAQAPEQRTHMVLVDDFDYSNGWATPLPYVQIRLYASPPDQVAGLEHMDEWLHGLIRHEYVHILHLNMASGAVASGRSIFGNMWLFYPHLFTPSLFTEGLAVWLETNHEAGYGRLDASYFAMQMREELRDHQGDDLTQVAVPLRDWPGGKQYLYGAYFWQYLIETYGEQRARLYLQSYSRVLIPWFFQNSKARQIFGKSFKVLWADYRLWLFKKFARQDEVLVSGTALPVNADVQQVTAVSGSQLLQVVRNGEDRPHLLAWTSDGAQWQAQPLAAMHDVTDMDARDDGLLVVSRQLTRADGRDYNDLFLWSAADGWQRLTHDSRLRRVRWQAGGQTMIASRQQAGQSELWRVALDGNMTRLWRGDAGTVLGEFDLSAGGQQLVAAVKRPQQGWNLELLDLTTLQWTPLTDTRASENAPEYLPDGRVLFSADYDGRYNLYVLDTATGQAEQWSRVGGGAFRPRWLNGSVAYQEYTAQGFVQKVLTPVPLRSFPLTQMQGRYDYPPAVTETVPATLSDYTPWPTLAPTYWWPLLSLEEHSTSLGVATSGNDAIGRHSYSLAASWDFKQNWSDFSLSYLYDTRWLLAWNRTHSFHELNLGIEDDFYASREDLLLLQRDHLWDGLEDQLQLHAGLSADHQKIIRAPSAISTGEGYEETLAGLALTFDNREVYRNVPGIGWGTYADLVYESNDVLNSDFNGHQWQSALKHTFDLPGRQTLALGLAGGVGDRGAEPFTIGGLSGEDGLLFGRDEFALPGYDDNIQIGHKYYNGVLRYSTWLSRIERNLGLTPLGFGDVSAGVWVQSASAWFRDQHRPQLTSVGAEIGLDVILAYNLALPLRLGVAQGLNNELGETQLYLRLDAAF